MGLISEKKKMYVLKKKHMSRQRMYGIHKFFLKYINNKFSKKQKKQEDINAQFNL